MNTPYAEPSFARDRAEATIIPVLKLRRGGSPIAQWAMGDDDIGKFVTVGRDPLCDWPISSPGLALRELSFRFGGDALFVRSERVDPGARMNGQRLSQEWQKVSRGARIDCGTACIEVQWHDTAYQVEPAPFVDSDSGVRRRPEPPLEAHVIEPSMKVQHEEPASAAADEPTIVIDPGVYHDAGPWQAPTLQRERPPQAVLLRHAWEGDASEDDAPVALLPEAHHGFPGLRYAWIPAVVMVGYTLWVTFAEL